MRAVSIAGRTPRAGRMRLRVFLTVLEFLWWLQPDPGVGGPAPASPSGAPAGAAASGGPDYMMTIAMVGVMLFVFYFFLIRPENQRRQKHEEMVASLRKGTKVRTSGGILGEVVSVNGEELVLKIADKVRINVLANNVSVLETDRKAQGLEGGGSTKPAEKTQGKDADSAQDGA